MSHELGDQDGVTAESDASVRAPSGASPSGVSGQPDASDWMSGGTDTPEYSLGRLLIARADAPELVLIDLDTSTDGGEGHASSMYLRGFDAGEGEDLALTVDGLPLNEIANHHGHGYADVTFLPVEAVRAVRVVEGPFDPAQGDFSVAGSADFTLGLPESGLTASVQLGAFGRRRLFVGYRPRDERAATFLAATLERGEGFGPSRAFGRAAVLGQHEAKLGAGTYVRTLAFFAAQRWDSAGVLPERVYRTRSAPCDASHDAQFFCTLDPNQGGAGQRSGVSAVLERASARSVGRAQLFLATRTLRTKENFTGFSLDPRLDGGPQRGDLRDGRTEALTLGLRAHVAARAPWLGRTHTLTAGIDARHDITDVAMDRVRRELDVPYLSDFDRGVRQSNLAAHVRVDAHLLPRLRRCSAPAPTRSFSKCATATCRASTASARA